MDSAGSHSERFVDQPVEAQAYTPDAGEAPPDAPAFAEEPPRPAVNGSAEPPAQPAFEYAPLFLPPAPPEQMQDMAFAATAPLPPLTSPVFPAVGALPAFGLETAQTAPAGSGSAAVFRIDQQRLAALQEQNWRQVRGLLIVLAVGVALGLLLLIPAVHQPPPPASRLIEHIPPGSHP